jgi:hypothetical protein
MGGFKVRLGDGSEIGPMDLAALRTWLAQGLVDGDSPVMRPGSRKWTPLASVPELKGALGSTRPRAARRAARAGPSRAASDATTAAEPGPLDRWRTRGVGALLLAAAAALGYLAWRPDEAAPAFDGAPWARVALGALALGLCLVPGWDLGRRLVRVALLLVAFALFPLAGILIAQGERGPGLLALASAWVFASTLAALLPRTLGPAPAVVLLVPVLAAGYGAWHFGRAAEGEGAERVRQWASPDRRYADDTLGLVLELPQGWVALRPGSPLLDAPPSARVAVAQPRHGGFGYLVAEPAPRGVATAEQYLDEIASRRRTERPGHEAGARASALVGALAGRRLDASWAEEGERHREVVVAALDGWMAFALVAWMPEAGASRPDGLDALARGLAARGLLAGRLQAAIDAAVAGVPHLSAPAAAQLMARSEARLLEPDQAFRRSIVALARLLPELTRAETRELTALTTATYAGVPWAQRSRLAAYVERVRRSATTTPEEDREMAALMKAAEEKLTPARRLRLQAYYEKAIQAES